MRVLEKKAASGIDTERREATERPVVTKGSGFRTYLVVGLAAAALGVGAVVGANQLGLVGTDRFTPAQIAEIRGAEFAGYAESLWRADLGRIQEQRAQDMVEFYSHRHQARISQINEQRAQDMVTFQRGWQGEAGS